MSLAIDTQAVNNGARVVIEGEVDVSNATEFTNALDAVLEDKAPVIDVDLEAVPYIDSTGIGVLVAAAHRATEMGSEFTVSHPQPNVLRVLTLLGVGSEFHVNEA